jgi:tRNA(Ile)-lysidine synthase
MKNGTKLLSDYLTDKKVNLLDKKEQFVVVDSITNKIVWLIGQEIDNEYRITPETNKIIKLYTYK